MFPRSFLTHIRYARFRRFDNGGCDFCSAHANKTSQLIKDVGTMAILSNRFPYSRWDGWKVGEHLMIVPARHVTSLSNLTEQESLDLMACVTDYETNGYSFYIRSHANKSKSVPHLHGHMIKSR